MGNEPRKPVVEALARLVARHGMDGASVRRVADEAGVSIGMVQHHFPTKDAMLRAAMDAMSARFRARAATATAGRAPGEALRALAHELLPLDDVRRDDGRVWLAFVARAAVDPALGAEHAAGWQELEDVLAALLAGHRDRTPRDADRDDARLLLAILDGLAVGGVAEPARLTPERIRAVLDPHLDVLLARGAGGSV